MVFGTELGSEDFAHPNSAGCSHTAGKGVGTGGMVHKGNKGLQVGVRGWNGFDCSSRKVLISNTQNKSILMKALGYISFSGGKRRNATFSCTFGNHHIFFSHSIFHRNKDRKIML